MAYRRIHNKGDWRHEEAVAAGTIKPGMILEMTTDGEVQAHSNEGGRHGRMVAVEDALQGNGVDTDYSEDDIVSIAVMSPGSVFNLLMLAGETGSPGQEVASDGTGHVILVSNLSTSTELDNIVGHIDASEAEFDALEEDTLKAIQIA